MCSRLLPVYMMQNDIWPLRVRRVGESSSMTVASVSRSTQHLLAFTLRVMQTN